MSRSFLLFGFILYSVFLSSLANASDIDLSAPMDKGGWKLIWSEEFDYTGFPDSTKWSYDTEGNVYQWGNNEAQYYTSGRKENAWVSDKRDSGDSVSVFCSSDTSCPVLFPLYR